MEELKLENRQLEEENAMLKSKLIEMGQFSKRMVEITAEMDHLLNQWASEIEKLGQESIHRTQMIQILGNICKYQITHRQTISYTSYWIFVAIFGAFLSKILT